MQAELEGLGIGEVPPHLHRAGEWSPLSLPSELPLASYGQQLTCTSQVFVYLVSWVMGKEEALEEVVVTHPIYQVESLKSSQNMRLCGLIYPIAFDFIINICKLESLTVCPKISYSYVWIVLIILSFGLTERRDCSATLAHTQNR